MDTPLKTCLYPLTFHVSEFRDKVSNYLSLHCNERVILYVEFAQLDRL